MKIQDFNERLKGSILMMITPADIDARHHENSCVELLRQGFPNSFPSNTNGGVIDSSNTKSFA